jgi:transcriptional regulator with XRE-family HTH domain
MNGKRGRERRTPKAMLRSELGRRIIKTRMRRGWTQAELARRLGVPRERLGKWERGLNAPSLEDLAALSEVLEVPLEGLGLGRGVRRTISEEELTELVFHLGAVARLLKPWKERRGEKEK